jgi:beta-lactamase regulating signal transducer with metallopeptidase domain
MNDSVLYALRLTEVCLASFFVLHFGLSLVVLSLTPAAIRVAPGLRASGGARLLFVLRLLPIALSTVIVLALCVPSYIHFEHDARENVGLQCLLLSLCGLVTVASSIVRAGRALAISRRAAVDMETRPVFALAGILRPRIMVSAEVRETLTREQMEAALRHEAAHARARDNVKRLALIASPRFLLFTDAHLSLERDWALLSEWAADEAAVASEPRCAVALAEALVRVARLSACSRMIPTASALVARPDDLAQRIQRILALSVADRPRERSSALRPLATAALVMLCAAPFSPGLQSAIHTVMERLVH